MFTYNILKEKNSKNKGKTYVDIMRIVDFKFDNRTILLQVVQGNTKETIALDIQYLILNIMTAKVYVTNISILRKVNFSLYVDTLYRPYLKNHKYISNTIDYGVGDYYFVDRLQAVSAVSNYATAYIQTIYMLNFGNRFIVNDDVIIKLLYVAQNRKLFDSTNYPLITKKFNDYEDLNLKGGLVFDERFNFILRDYLDNKVSDNVVREVINKFYRDEMIVFTDKANYKIIKKSSAEIPQKEKSKADDLVVETRKKVFEYYESVKIKNKDSSDKSGILERLDASKLYFNAV